MTEHQHRPRFDGVHWRCRTCRQVLATQLELGLDETSPPAQQPATQSRSPRPRAVHAPSCTTAEQAVLFDLTGS